MVNPPNNNGEQPSPSAGESTTALSGTESIPVQTSTTGISANAYSGPVLSLVHTKGPLVTPRQPGVNNFRNFPYGFTILMDGRE